MAAWLVLQGGERRLSVRSGALVVEHRGEPVRVLRPEDVEEVHAFGDVELTPAARRSLLHHGIDVVFHTRDGRVQGRLTSQESRAGERRLAQYRSVTDPARRLAVARAIVAGKVANQHTVLARIQRQARHEQVADALAALRAMQAAASGAADLDALRGVEGYAARVYFGVLGHGIRNPLFRFEGRNRRPPRDPVNAVLSFLYTLLCQRTEAAARGAGLDPFVGFLHEAGRGGAAAAFDLAEEWRPVVDALVLGLFNRKQLSPEDFGDPEVNLDRVSEAPEGPVGATTTREPAPWEAAADTAPESTQGEELGDTGDQPIDAVSEPEPPSAPERPRAVHLGPVGRSVVITAWARRMQERAWCEERGGRFPLEEIIRIQAQALARACVADPPSYQPHPWR